MKKVFLQNIFMAAVSVVCAVLIGCSDPIFYEINKEVKLNSAIVDGDVQSMVRASLGGSDYLVTQNGYLWYKNASSSSYGEWRKVSSIPGSVVKVASDGSYVYALVITYTEETGDNDYEGENIPEYAYIYSSSDFVTWQQSDLVHTYASPESDIVRLFCSKDENGKGNSAYVFATSNSSTSMYKLNGTSYAECSGGTNQSSSSVNAVYFNGAEYFSNYSAVAASSNYIYWANGDVIYWGTTTASEKGSYDVDCSSILSMAVTSDYLILGTEDGIEHVALNSDGSISSKCSSFSTNADSTLSSYYYVPMVFAVDPTLSETANTLYGSTVYKGSASAAASYWNNIGLWAYYSSRGNWNCE